MVEILSAGGSINATIIGYCKNNKLMIQSYTGKVPINGALKNRYTFAIKVAVENLLNNNHEVYLFAGTKAKFSGYLLLDVRRIE